MRLAASIALALAALLTPELGHACAVCTGNGEESRGAFIITTVGMSVLPLAMIGGVVWWVWRRSKAHAERSAGGAAAPPPVHTPG